MDKSHRDRVAFVRVCSGRFERGMVLTHDATGRPFATKYAQAMFGRDRSTIDEAFPGDIVGLVNATALRPGDTLWAEKPVTFPTIPSFAPEHFSVARVADASKTKQFRKGIEQLDSEGVIQVLPSDLRGDQAPVLAAVGPLQFEVVAARLADEFAAPDQARAPRLHARPAHRRRGRGRAASGAIGIEVLTRRADGELLALFPHKWRLQAVMQNQPDLLLEPLIAEGATP